MAKKKTKYTNHVDKIYTLDYIDYADGEYGETSVMVSSDSFESFRNGIINILEEQSKLISKLSAKKSKRNKHG